MGSDKKKKKWDKNVGPASRALLDKWASNVDISGNCSIKGFFFPFI